MIRGQSVTAMHARARRFTFQPHRGWLSELPETWRALIIAVTWQFYETPHHDTVTCRFDSDKVKIEFLSSVSEKLSAHKETRPALLGQIIA